MATLAASLPERSRFHLWMAGAVVLIAFGGFLPSYWAPVTAGRFTGAPILHIHGLLFFAWTLLFFSQSALVAAGRTPDHRRWGMLGLFLVGMMTMSVPLAVIAMIDAGDAVGKGLLARQFAVVPLLGLPLILGFFAVAIVNVGRPSVHRRAMLMMQVPLLQAAVGRVARLIAQGGVVSTDPPPGAFVALPAALAIDLLLVAAMVNDRRSEGRVHRAYLIGAPIIVAEQLLVVPVSYSPAWLSFTEWLTGLAR